MEMTNENLDLSAIQPGMPVFGVDGVLLGAVESIDADHSFRVLTHIIPPAAIKHIDSEGVHLYLARAAFTAAPPATPDQGA